MAQNWEDIIDYSIDLNAHVTGWDTDDPFDITKCKPHTTTPKERARIYNNIKQKLNDIKKMANEIIEYNIDFETVASMKYISDTISLSHYHVDSLINEQSEQNDQSNNISGPPIISNPIVTKFYEKSEIERKWKNKQ